MSVNEQYLLETYGPLLTLETTAKLLDRPESGVKQSALKKDNPLSKAKRKVGRRTYFSAHELAAIMDGTQEEL